MSSLIARSLEEEQEHKLNRTGRWYKRSLLQSLVRCGRTGKRSASVANRTADRNAHTQRHTCKVTHASHGVRRHKQAHTLLLKVVYHGENLEVTMTTFDPTTKLKNDWRWLKGPT